MKAAMTSTAQLAPLAEKPPAAPPPAQQAATPPAAHASSPVPGVELSPALVVRIYHRRTKHRFQAYAASPSTLDWDNQPAPFRHYSGAPTVLLPLLAEAPAGSPLQDALAAPYAGLTEPRPALAADLAGLGALLQLSLGLTGWKSLGPDRWAVRANPSSGNLHPVEAWVICRNFPGLADGVHHYRPEDHALECRAADAPGRARGGPRLAIALSSVMWREAWKYGERAFRYCQLDVGHAAGALRQAAAVLGWTLAEQPGVGSASLAARLGLDRSADYPYRRYQVSELEEPELLFAIGTDGSRPAAAYGSELREAAATACWHGTASTIDPYPMFRWPVIAEVAAASRREDGDAAPAQALPPPSLRPQPATGASVAGIILGRRSAQRFAPDHILTRDRFAALLQAIKPHCAAPWDALADVSRLTPVLFVHRVEGLRPGIYVFVRESAAAAPLLARLQQRFAPERVAGLPPELDLRLLQEYEPVQLRRLARSLHCHQDIAANACFAVGLLAPFDSRIGAEPAAYRSLFREAGLIGQVLYLQAEALGLRGTGIGCYFDDPVHEALGLEGESYQSLYHFTIGMPVIDNRIETTPAYADRAAAGTPAPSAQPNRESPQ